MSSTSTAPSSWARRCLRILACPHAKKRKAVIPPTPKRWRACGDYSPVIGHILQYRTYQKLNSTYVEGLLKVVGADGRIHSTFNQRRPVPAVFPPASPICRISPCEPSGQPLPQIFHRASGRNAAGRGLQPDRTAPSCAHLRRRSHVRGVPFRRRHPPQHCGQNLRSAAGTGHARAAFVRQGGQLRHRVRHRRVQPVQDIGASARKPTRSSKLFRQFPGAKNIWTRPWSRAVKTAM
ncbi:MAG: DNA polymerase [Ruthenibacterium lactatiformans]